MRVCSQNQLQKSRGQLPSTLFSRSNLSICDAAIRVNLRELENYVATEIQTILENTQPTDIPTSSHEDSSELLAIEQKIDRLVSALAESNEVSIPYITRQIEKLHKERETLLSQKAQTHAPVRRLDFYAASFEDKKLIAAEFIDRILLENDNVNIMWKI